MSFITNAFANSGLSEASIKSRTSYLKSLGITTDNYRQVLGNLDIVKSNSVNTMLTRVFHILSFIKLLKDEEDVDLIIRYTKLADKLKRDQETQRLNNNRNDRFVSLENLQKKLLEAKPEFNITKIQHTDILQTYKDIENYVLISMYVNTPAVRNDYRQLIIVSNAKSTNDADNFIVINSRGAYVILNKYKTAKSFGKVKLSIDKETTKCIRDMLKFRKSVGLESPFLFNHISKRGLEPIGAQINMIMRIRNVSIQIFGFIQTINDFRHAWETHIQSQPEYQTMTLAQRATEHAKLLHHLPIALEYNRV